ncbi:MAG: hypothetical protein J0L87_06000 [Bacteroidetes bacterium]|nr:hypothetical protein [Bacteroidota bacterium]
MIIVIDCLLIVLLGVIAFQDFKFRAISWYLLPLILFLLLYKGLCILENEVLVKNSSFNLAFVIIQFVGLTVYMSIKNKKIVNIVNSYIGLGDLLFFVVICVAFSPFNFILFFVVSNILTLIIFTIYKIFISRTVEEIPLAGAQSIMFQLLIFYNMFISPVDFYSDDLFLSMHNLQ